MKKEHYKGTKAKKTNPGETVVSSLSLETNLRNPAFSARFISGKTRVYFHLLRHALTTFACRDLLRFLDRRVNRRFAGEVTTVYRDRSKGVCVKHCVEENAQRPREDKKSETRNDSDRIDSDSQLHVA